MKAIAATMALQEQGCELSVFRMTPHRDLAAEIKKSLSKADAQSPADYLRRRIVRHVNEEVGRVLDGGDVEAIVVTEVSPAGTFHTHLLVNRRNSPKLRKALRLAGGEWDEHRQFQCDCDAEGDDVTPGWLAYLYKEFGKELCGISMSRTVQQKARRFYETFRGQAVALRSPKLSKN